MEKRLSLWLYDLYQDYKDITELIKEFPFLGVKGATGSADSFVKLGLDVDALEKDVAKQMGFENIFPLATQTYPRKFDIRVLNILNSYAASAHKIATDIRLLSHLKEIKEGFGKTQIGSSAMPHKRNPIYSERVCALSRFLISLSQNAAYTHATQWLERTLDDSANRRLSISESFLAADSITLLLKKIFSGLEIDEEIISSNLKKELPNLCLESILMEATSKGKDRQVIHEKLCNYVRAGKDFLSLIANDREIDLSKSEIEKFLNPNNLIGKAPDQVSSFLKKLSKI